jgi:hypothetical protein
MEVMEVMEMMEVMEVGADRLSHRQFISVTAE